MEALDRKWKVWEHRWCFHFSLHLKVITLERAEEAKVNRMKKQDFSFLDQRLQYLEILGLGTDSGYFDLLG